MCQKCVDAMQKYWPHLSPDQQDTLIWAGTAYPAVDGEDVARQLRELAEASGGDFDRAMLIAHETMDWAADGPISPGTDEYNSLPEVSRNYIDITQIENSKLCDLVVRTAAQFKNDSSPASKRLVDFIDKIKAIHGEAKTKAQEAAKEQPKGANCG